VFEFVRACVWDADYKNDNTLIKAVGIYSSQSGDWAHRSAWEHPIAIRHIHGSAFFDGVMYLSSYDDLVVPIVDVEGNCRVIHIPTPHDSYVGFDVYQSRGQLYLAKYHDSELSLWILEDLGTEHWTLKHKVSHLQLFGEEYSSVALEYDVIIHPDDNLIFILWSKKCPNRRKHTTLMSYGMDFKQPRFICDLGWGCMAPYLRYVPFFSEALADGH
jgi:hypothetical protein